MLRTKSVTSPIEKSDGLRVLATRFRGRGMSASRYDVWLPALAPSEQLLEDIQQGRITWKAFTSAYLKELLEDGPVDERCDTIKNHGQKSLLRLLKHMGEGESITLMCHCAEDAAQCHRHVLKKFLESPRAK